MGRSSLEPRPVLSSESERRDQRLGGISTRLTPWITPFVALMSVAMTFESLEEFLSDATNDQKWDLQQTSGGYASEEDRIDAELRRAGIYPGDPRLFPKKGDISEDGLS